MSDLNDHFSILIYRLGQAELAFINNQLKKYKVTLNYARILNYVESHPGCGQKTVADHLNYQPASLTHMIKRMESLGMISRQASAGTFPYQKKLYLEPKGRKVIADINTSFAKLDALVGSSDDQTIKRLHTSLKKLETLNQQN